MSKFKDYSKQLGIQSNNNNDEVYDAEFIESIVDIEDVDLVTDVEPVENSNKITLELPVVRGALDPAEWLTTEKLLQLQKWGEEGLSYELIARNMGVSRNMLQRWRNEHFEIEEAILLGREVATGHVEEALYKKACGYYVDKVVIDVKGNEHVIKEYVQPDIKAIQYYLNNRCKDRWSANIQHQTNIQVPIIFGEDAIRK